MTFLLMKSLKQKNYNYFMLVNYKAKNQIDFQAQEQKVLINCLII